MSFNNNTLMRDSENSYSDEPKKDGELLKDNKKQL
jgi:hypothetical protein